MSLQVNTEWTRGNKAFFMFNFKLSMKFHLLLKTNFLKNEDFAFKPSDVFIMLINVKMPTVVGILTFMSMINSCLVELSLEKLL